MEICRSQYRSNCNFLQISLFLQYARIDLIPFLIRHHYLRCYIFVNVLEGPSWSKFFNFILCQNRSKIQFYPPFKIVWGYSLLYALSNEPIWCSVKIVIRKLLRKNVLFWIFFFNFWESSALTIAVRAELPPKKNQKF